MESLCDLSVRNVQPSRLPQPLLPHSGGCVLLCAPKMWSLEPAGRARLVCSLQHLSCIQSCRSLSEFHLFKFCCMPLYMTFIVSYKYINFIFLTAQQAPGGGNHAEPFIQQGSGWHGHKSCAGGQGTRVLTPDLLSTSCGTLGLTLLIHKIGTSVTHTS